MGVMDLFKGGKREGKPARDPAGTREKPSPSPSTDDTVEIAALRDDGAGTSR